MLSCSRKIYSKNTFNLGLKSIILFFVLFLSICAVSAHQPRLEVGVNSSLTNPIVVQNPEISQAFYGNLNGQPDYYKITSSKIRSLSLTRANQALNTFFLST
jgi:hypothetical protein